MLILKNKKIYYFNASVNKNHFEKQQLNSHTRFKELSFKLYKLT
jgi:hypothetical protein